MEFDWKQEEKGRIKEQIPERMLQKRIEEWSLEREGENFEIPIGMNKTPEMRMWIEYII